MTIKRLPPEIAAKIAAGEVAERPVSVVKELLENSLDSGASMISIRLVQGGRLSIVVEDDGHGMDQDDLLLSIQNHATSKIRSLEDLEAVDTLGYRGEALPSIGAVSTLSIISRTDSSPGAWVKAEAGAVLSRGERSCSKGTRVQVDDLFFNLPARRKFLKSPAAELKRTVKLVQDYSVAYPLVSFTLFDEDRLVYGTPGGGDREDVLAKLWGKDPEIRNAQSAEGSYKVKAWWQRSPGSARINLMSFVNGRRIDERTIRAAIASGEMNSCGNWAVWIETAPGEIDVNVHPAKTQVLFRHSGDLFGAVKRCVSLLREAPAPLIAGTGPFSSQPLFAPSRFDVRSGGEEARTYRVAQRTEESPESSVVFLGQLRSGYLLFDDEGALVVMDHHAAHERLNFEAIRRKCKEGCRTQKLAVPVPLPPGILTEDSEKLAHLASFGFLLKPRDGLLILQGIPEIPGCDSMAPETLLRSALSGLDEGSINKEAVWLRWATLACKASVKLTRSLSPQEALALYDRLSRCGAPPACPHGRPAILRISPERLRSGFERS